MHFMKKSENLVVFIVKPENKFTFQEWQHHLSPLARFVTSPIFECIINCGFYYNWVCRGLCLFQATPDFPIEFGEHHFHFGEEIVELGDSTTFLNNLGAYRKMREDGYRFIQGFHPRGHAEEAARWTLNTGCEH